MEVWLHCSRPYTSKSINRAQGMHMYIQASGALFGLKASAGGHVCTGNQQGSCPQSMFRFQNALMATFRMAAVQAWTTGRWMCTHISLASSAEIQATTSSFQSRAGDVRAVRMQALSWHQAWPQCMLQGTYKAFRDHELMLCCNPERVACRSQASVCCIMLPEF